MAKTSVATCAKEDIAKAVWTLSSSMKKPRAASICDELFPETKGLDPIRRQHQLRAVDRGLQAAKRAGLIAFDSKTGWSVTGVSK